jgi:hypothetical protein
MENRDFDKRAEELAVRIEERISDGEAFIADLPDFKPRSERSKKLRQQTRNGK